MLALGVRPIAAGTQGGTIGSGFAPHLAGLVDGIEPLAWADGAPAEAIAALEPDLIFVPDADSADLLDDIAPVVPAGAADAADWQEDLRYVAAVLGRSDDAEALVQAYEADADALAERLAPVVDGRTAASPQVAFDHSQVYLDGPDAFSSVILTDLGLDLAPIVAEATEIPIAVSFERLTDIDADILFWQVRQRDEDGSRDTAGLQVAQDSPLYGQLPAVAAGAVHEVENRPWYFPTILAARRVLADVEAALL
jgi:iron complex transport system substrate-binding protein